MNNEGSAERVNPPALVMATRTARRTMCHGWAFKCWKVQPGFQVQSSSERVRISWNLVEASSQCSLFSTPLPGVQVGKW